MLCQGWEDHPNPNPNVITSGSEGKTNQKISNPNDMAKAKQAYVNCVLSHRPDLHWNRNRGVHRLLGNCLDLRTTTVLLSQWQHGPFRHPGAMTKAQKVPERCVYVSNNGLFRRSFGVFQVLWGQPIDRSDSGERSVVNRDKILIVSEQHFMQHARNKKGYIHAKRIKMKREIATLTYATLHPPKIKKSIMQL